MGDLDGGVRERGQEGGIEGEKHYSASSLSQTIRVRNNFVNDLALPLQSTLALFLVSLVATKHVSCAEIRTHAPPKLTTVYKG